MSSSRARPSWGVILGVSLWALAVVGGYCWMTADSFKPGKMVATHFVDKNALHELSPTHPTLFVFLHPECPCSRATVEELSRISAGCEDRIKIVALFEDYTTLPEKPDMSELWHKASRIPGLSAFIDKDAVISRQLKVATSGECILLDPEGHPLFHGGITSARGHSGESAGGDAIISLCQGRPAPLSTAPVFGCALFND